MTGLPDGRKSFKIGLVVQTQYRPVTDRQTVAVAKTALCYATCVARAKIDYNDCKPSIFTDIYGVSSLVVDYFRFK